MHFSAFPSVFFMVQYGATRRLAHHTSDRQSHERRCCVSDADHIRSRARSQGHQYLRNLTRVRGHRHRPYGSSCPCLPSLAVFNRYRRRPRLSYPCRSNFFRDDSFPSSLFHSAPLTSVRWLACCCSHPLDFIAQFTRCHF